MLDKAVGVKHLASCKDSLTIVLACEIYSTSLFLTIVIANDLNYSSFHSVLSHHFCTNSLLKAMKLSGCFTKFSVKEYIARF